MLNKILIVDDSAVVHSMYKFMLHRYNCEIVDAMNGQEALDILATRSGIQLVILDINMPVMSGLQFMEKAVCMTSCQKTPIIVVSTEDKNEDIIRGLRMGAAGYMKKPFDPRELYELIERLTLPAAEKPVFRPVPAFA